LKELELTEDQRQEVVLMEAIQQYLEGDIYEAISGLSTAFPLVKDVERKRKYITVLVGFLLENHQYQEASHYTQELINSAPDDPIGHFLRWNVANRQGDQENSSTYLQKAVSLCQEKTENSTLWDIANALLGLEDYKNAATILRKGADLEVFSKVTQNLIIAEFKSGNYRDAHDLSDKLMQTYPLNPILTEIKASILEATGQFDAAEGVIGKFLEANPDDVFFRVKLAMNLYKNSRYTRGIEELDKIGKYDSIPVHHQFLIADAYIQGGDAVKGLEIAYKLRMQHYGEEWIHQRFLQLQTRLTHLSHATYFPKTVGIDCYVSLKNNNGKTLEYIIVNQVQYPLDIRINEPMAQELLGKQLGDTFVKNNLTYEVTGIKWKYTYALHDSLDQIQNRFKNDGPMRVLEFKPGTNPLEMISQVLNPMKGGQVFARSLDDLYMRGQSTIGVNASRLGVSAVKYWNRLVALPDMGILTIGTKDELIRAMKLIEDGTPLVFDMVALLTLQQSNGFAILEQLKNDKYVAQSTIDEIEAELEEAQNRKDVEDLNFLEVNGQFTRQIVTVEEKSKIIRNLTLFLDNIKNTTKRTQPTLPADFNEKSELDRVIGKAFHDSLLIAKDHNALLLSDDRTFRVMAHNDFGVSGLPCLGLVQYLARQNSILPEKADAIHESLVRSNYRHIPMRPELLMRICQKDNFRISNAFTRACDCLEPMIMDDERAAAFVSIFFRMLSLQINLSTTRDSIVSFVLNILYNNRDKSKVKALLMQYLERQFILLPIQKKEILDIIGIL
jgi:tetratricopeptide (TPR) repeat protein